MPDNIPAARLRVEFAVREISIEGQDDTEVRYIKFSQDIEISEIREYFESKGTAVAMIFAGLEVGTQSIALKFSPINKIAAIKALRTLTGLGLKEAKDRVEARDSAPMLFVRDSQQLQACLKVFGRDANLGKDDLVIRRCARHELVQAGVPEYQKPTQA